MMVKKFILILSITNIFFSLISGIEVKELISLLEEKDKSITKLKAEYVQTINFLDLQEVYVINSTFVYLKPDKLKLVIVSPFYQTIVVNGENLWLKDNVSETLYYTKLDKYFSKNWNIFPLVFSKGKDYSLSELIKKAGIRFVSEEKNYYVLSTRYAKGKVYKDKKVGLRPGETRFIIWINKDTLFPEKINMISEKYIIETYIKNYITEFDLDEKEFTIDKDSVKKVIELKLE